jgi:hypothetical protein
VCGRAVTPGAGARQTADADSLLGAARADARRRCALPCGRWSGSDSLVCGRPSRRARCWCFSVVAGVRCSIRLSVLALVAALPALRPPLLHPPRPGCRSRQSRAHDLRRWA